MCYSSGIGTSPSPEETAVKIRARNNFRDKYTRENEEHQKQKRIEEQGEVWQQQRVLCRRKVAPAQSSLPLFCPAF